MNLANHIQNKSYYFVSNGKSLLLYKKDHIAWATLWKDSLSIEDIALGFSSYEEAVELSQTFEDPTVIYEIRDIGYKIIVREVNK